MASMRVTAGGHASVADGVAIRVDQQARLVRQSRQRLRMASYGATSMPSAARVRGLGVDLAGDTNKVARNSSISANARNTGLNGDVTAPQVEQRTRCRRAWKAGANRHRVRIECALRAKFSARGSPHTAWRVRKQAATATKDDRQNIGENIDIGFGLIFLDENAEPAARAQTQHCAIDRYAAARRDVVRQPLHVQRAGGGRCFHQRDAVAGEFLLRLNPMAAVGEESRNSRDHHQRLPTEPLNPDAQRRACQRSGRYSDKCGSEEGISSASMPWRCMAARRSAMRPMAWGRAEVSGRSC